jgi:cbb3-type cytochrome oxidase subunit 3
MKAFGLAVLVVAFLAVAAVAYSDPNEDKPVQGSA